MQKRPMRKTLSPVNLSKRGVPKRFHDIKVEDLKDYGSEERRELLKTIVKYINNLDAMFNKNVGLFMYGSNGVGKSFIASLIVKEGYKHRYTSKRCTFVEYVQEYTRMWNVKDSVEREHLEELFYHNYKAVEFLCLEEVGKELDTKLSPVVLEDLLRYREEKGYPTIICTNISPKTLVEQYGASIGSLIKGNFIPIKLVGKDRRQEVFNELLDEE